MDADVGDSRRAAGAQDDLDPLDIAGRGESGGGGVVALRDIGLELEEDVGELVLRGGGGPAALGGGSSSGGSGWAEAREDGHTAEWAEAREGGDG